MGRSIKTGFTGLAVFFVLVSTGYGDRFQVPSLVPNVLDSARVLSPGEVDSINQAIQSLRQSVDVRAAVLILPSLQGLSIEDAAERVFRSWKLGEAKKDNGLLMIFALQERKSRIEVGYGLESEITDAVSIRILDGKIMPQFKTGHYAEGILRGLSALEAVKEGRALDLPLRPVARQAANLDWPSAKTRLLAWLLLVWVLQPAMRVFAWLASRVLNPGFNPNLLLARRIRPGEWVHRPEFHPLGWILPQSFAIRLFLTLNPGLFFVIVPGFENLGNSTWLLYGFIVLLFAWIHFRNDVRPAISTRAFLRRRAALRLSRMRTRVEGPRTLFGRPYSYSKPTSSSSSSFSSGGSSSSSSGGGSSGGGGASSSW